MTGVQTCALPICNFLGFGGTLVIFWVSKVFWSFLGFESILVIFRFREYFSYFLDFGGTLVILFWALMAQRVVLKILKLPIVLLLLRDCDKEVEAEGSEEAVGKCRGVVAMVCFFWVYVSVFCVVKIREIMGFFFLFFLF